MNRESCVGGMEMEMERSDRAEKPLMVRLDRMRKKQDARCWRRAGVFIAS